MNIFGRELLFGKKALMNDDRRPASSQTREALNDPFSASFNGYEPLKFNLGLYQVIREAIPVLDVAVLKIVRLIGDFRYIAENARDQQLLDDFKQSVKVGWFQQGLNFWLKQLNDSALSLGMGFGELVPLASNSGVHRLKIAHAQNFRFMRDSDNRLVLGTVQRGGMKPRQLAFPDYVYYLAFDVRNGSPQGVSLFYSLPFVVQIYTRIEKAIENTIWRVGDPTFIAVVKGSKFAKYAEVKQAKDAFLTELTEVNKDRRQSKVRDIGVATPNESDFELKVLGEGAEMLDIKVPSRIILEQIIAKTELFPYMFGLYDWNSNFRMSSDQADMLVSNINSYRKQNDPIIRKVTDQFLTLSGHAGVKYTVEWDPVNLMDEKEMANARALNATALQKELTAFDWMLERGFITEDEILEFLVNNGFGSKKNINGEQRLVLEQFVKRNKKAFVGKINKSVLN